MKIKCPKCKGSKQEIINVNLDLDAPDYDPVYVFRPCIRCQGKGKINNKIVKFKPEKYLGTITGRSSSKYPNFKEIKRK